MRWIVLTQDRPAMLHALLESAGEFLPSVVPDVLLRWGGGEPARRAYELLSQRLACRWHNAPNGLTWRSILIDLIGNYNQDGKVEQTVLITTDDMLFRRTVSLVGIWNSIQGGEILGLNLWLSPPPVAQSLHPGSGNFTWEWSGSEGELGSPFTFGTVYRTSNILGPICRRAWDSLDTLVTAITGDSSLRIRRKMMCLPDPVMTRTGLQDFPGSDAMYLSGYVLDRTDLLDGHYRWVSYQK